MLYGKRPHGLDVDCRNGRGVECVRCRREFKASAGHLSCSRLIKQKFMLSTDMYEEIGLKGGRWKFINRKNILVKSGRRIC
jgi:hypothetical protein